MIVLNEQITNPDGSLTVNAAHYYLGYVLDQNGEPGRGREGHPQGRNDPRPGRLRPDHRAAPTTTTEATTTTTVAPTTTTTTTSATISTTPPRPGTVPCQHLAAAQIRLHAQLDAVLNTLRAVLSGPAQERAVARIEALRVRLSTAMVAVQTQLACPDILSRPEISRYMYVS